MEDNVIEVQNLVKHYGAVKAVDDISFTVERGEILGFLGPNAAGKTTTMRITRLYAASAGSVKIAGMTF
jgi:ABC-2 type transport system ATP-binding protein